MKSVTGVCIGEDQIVQIESVGKKIDRSRSWIVRKLIEKHLDELLRNESREEKPITPEK